MSTTSAPASAAPSRTAAAIDGDESRVSRPTQIRLGSNWSTYARPTAYAPASSSCDG